MSILQLAWSTTNSLIRFVVFIIITDNSVNYGGPKIHSSAKSNLPSGSASGFRFSVVGNGLGQQKHLGNLLITHLKSGDSSCWFRGFLKCLKCQLSVQIPRNTRQVNIQNKRLNSNIMCNLIYYQYDATHTFGGVFNVDLIMITTRKYSDCNSGWN